MGKEENNKKEKMLKLQEELLAAQEARLAGVKGCSVDELESYLDKIIKKLS